VKRYIWMLAALLAAIVISVAATNAKSSGPLSPGADLQAAIFEQQKSCDTIHLTAGRFVLPKPLVPTGEDGRAHCPLRIDGVGPETILTHETLEGFIYNGLIGYGAPGVPARPQLAPMVVTDLTLDGGYQGAGCGGKLPYRESGGQAALVSLAAPWTDAWTWTRPTGNHHVFRRVRFQCTTGYGFQPLADTTIEDSLFSRMGQPDQPRYAPDGHEVPHWDIIGSGHDGYGIIRRNEYRDSSGNYIDLEGSVPIDPNQPITAGPVSVEFTDNVSYNHQIGGVYGLGVESRILRNRLRNRLSGSYVGYDGMTRDRARNIVAFNTVDRIEFYAYDGVNNDSVVRNRTIR